ncbi:hypothetical protein [Streptomyces halobius]|uniref:Transcriptional regulator n=1 Tax=Streptomyces halobius TaxID=2879846 RepID=A0ABY4M9J8_9ACTN|nr:hypothetical protein [Streptomyces halobius]UQA94460.1 hypothetical protein K9S39_23685 [Streptomyces halobius]
MPGMALAGHVGCESEGFAPPEVPHFDFDAQLAADVPSGTKINVLGRFAVDGKPVASSKTMEFVTALASAGGSMSRDGLHHRIYERDVSASTLPTLAYRARKLGIDVRYETLGRRYVLTQSVSVDALMVLGLLKAGKPAEALILYQGPCLPECDSPFAVSLRQKLESQLVRSVLDSGDQDLIRAASRLIDHWELAEPAAAGDDPLSAVLSHSYLRSMGLSPAGQR